MFFSSFRSQWNRTRALAHNYTRRNYWNVLYTGGSGSGKTHLLAHRIVDKINTGDVQPSKVVMLAPSQASAFKIQSTVNSKTKFLPYNSCTITTFEGFISRLLRQIVTKDPSQEYKSLQLEELCELLKQRLPKSFSELPVIPLVRYFQQLNNLGISPEEIAGQDSNKRNISCKIISEYYSNFLDLINNENIIVGKSSCIRILNKILKNTPDDIVDLGEIEQLALDDYQFFGNEHLDFISYINQKFPDIQMTIAGDDTQRFGGSFYSTVSVKDVESKLLIPAGKEYSIIHTETQFRSNESIVKLREQLQEHQIISEQIIQKYPSHIRVVCYEDQFQGVANSIRSNIESGVSPEDIVVLVRTNTEVQSMCENLESFGLRAKAGGLRLFDMHFVRFIVSFLQILVGNSNANAKAYWDLLSEPSPFALSKEYVSGLVSRVMDEIYRSREELSIEDHLYRDISSLTEDDQSTVSQLFNHIAHGRNSILRGATLTELVTHFRDVLHLEDFLNSHYSSSSDYLSHSRFMRIIQYLEETKGNSVHNAIEELHKIRCTNTDKTPRCVDEDSDEIRVMTVHRARMEGIESEIVYFPSFTQANYPQEFSNALKEVLPSSLLQWQQADIQAEMNVLCSGISRSRSAVQFSFGKSQLPSVWLSQEIIRKVKSQYIPKKTSLTTENDTGVGRDLFKADSIKFELLVPEIEPHPAYLSFHSLKTLANCELKFIWQKLYPTQHAIKQSKMLKARKSEFSHLGILLRLCCPGLYDSSLWSQSVDCTKVSDSLLRHVSNYFEHTTPNSIGKEIEKVVDDIMEFNHSNHPNILRPLPSATLQFTDGDITIFSENTEDNLGNRSLAREAILMDEQLVDYGIRSSRFQVELYFYIYERIFNSKLKEAIITQYSTNRKIKIVPTPKVFQTTDQMMNNIRKLNQTGIYTASPNDLLCASCKFSSSCPAAHHQKK